MNGADPVRAYYEAIDADDYDRLASLLAPEFEHDRSDRTLAGREAFVSFMREDRPAKDTVHELRAIYRTAGGDGEASEDAARRRDAARPGEGKSRGAADGGREEWAARGRLIGPDREPIFEFVDVFRVGEDGRFRRLTTFARQPTDPA